MGNSGTENQYDRCTQAVDEIFFSGRTASAPHIMVRLERNACLTIQWETVTGLGRLHNITCSYQWYFRALELHVEVERKLYQELKLWKLQIFLLMYEAFLEEEEQEEEIYCA